MEHGWENNLPNAIKGILKLKDLGEQDRQMFHSRGYCGVWEWDLSKE